MLDQVQHDNRCSSNVKKNSQADCVEIQNPNVQIPKHLNPSQPPFSKVL